MPAAFRNLSVTLLIVLLADGVQNRAWSHDVPASEKAQPAQRREVRIPVRDFSLTDQDGRPFQFRPLKGKVVLAAFGYTTCPDICPLVTAAMRSAQNKLAAAEKHSVYLLTITTDPEIDSPRVLSLYAQRYGVDHSNWAFLTGGSQALNAVWKNFGVRVVRKARGLIDHTPLTAMIGSDGVMRLVYVGTAPDSKIILKDMRSLLARSLGP